MDAAEKAGKEIEKMKSKLIAVAALAALTAAAMPTKDEIAQANKDVQASLKTQIAAWQSGDISDGDLAALMLINAGKFKDEPRHYACLQAAFAAAVRVGDVALAANVIEKMSAETKGFGLTHENALFSKVFGKMDARKADDFRRRLEIERGRVACTRPVPDTAAATVVKMRNTMIPAMAFKPPATLEDVLAFLQKASKENDSRKEGVNFLLKMGEGESAPAVPTIRASNISVYDAVALLTRIAGYDFEVKDNIVVIFKKGDAEKK